MGLGIAIAATALSLGGIAAKMKGASDTFGALRKQNSDDQFNAKKQMDKLEYLENNRQDVTNFSSGLSNPFNNLGVATAAAEMQIEQSDIALANTLDTIRATGGAAGGATALAQAALQSKQSVAASIESQETANQKLAAQGEAYLQQQVLAENTRVFNVKEQREMDRLDRQAALADNATAQARASQTNKILANQARLNLVGDVLGSAAYGISSYGGSN